jgi:hypothetical protein
VPVGLGRPGVSAGAHHDPQALGLQRETGNGGDGGDDGRVVVVDCDVVLQAATAYPFEGGDRAPVSR